MTMAVKWCHTINLSDVSLEALNLKLVILEFSFGRFTLSRFNYCVIILELPIIITRFATLLGNNGKMTAGYKLIRCLIRNS